MGATGTYATYVYSTTNTIYRTYSDNGTGFSLKHSSAGTALLNYQKTLSADGTKFITIASSSGSWSITVYHASNLSVYTTIGTTFPSNIGAVLYTSL